MSWRKQGGVNRSDTINNINVSTIVADSLTLKDYYYGNFEILGNIHASGSIETESNLIANYVGAETVLANTSLKVLKNATVYANSAVKRDMYAYQRVVVGNIERNNNVLTLMRNDNFGNFFIEQAKITDAFMGLATEYFTGKIGINAPFPEAALDIFSGLQKVIDVKSNDEINYNILARNVNNTGVVLYADNTTTSVRFFNETEIDGNAPDAIIEYVVGGNLYLDTSNNTSIHSTLTVSNRDEEEHVLGETAVIYDPSYSEPLLYDIYERAEHLAGNALSLVAYDSSSSTVMNIITPNKQGLFIAGGVYPYDKTKPMAILGTVSETGERTPAMSITASDNHRYNKNTVSINSHFPLTGDRALDVNGKVMIRNAQTTLLVQSDFEILNYYVSHTYPEFSFALGTPYTLQGDADTFMGTVVKNYQQKMLYSRDYGKTWTEANFNETDIGLVYNTFKGVYIYDTSLVFVGADYGIVYFTNDGGETWQSIINVPLSVNIHSIYARHMPDEDTIRVFIVGETNLYWFDVGMDIYDINNGINSQSISYSTINFQNNFHAKMAKGSSNYLYIIGQRDPPGSNLSFYCINKYSITGVISAIPTIAYESTNRFAYNGLSVYNDDFVVAVGNSIITYTLDGGASNFTDLIYNQSTNAYFYLNGVVFNTVDILNPTSVVAIGYSSTETVMLYSNTTITEWKRISPAFLFNSGAPLSVLSSQQISNLFITDAENIVFTNVLSNYDFDNRVRGESSVFNLYAPSIFNEEYDFVLNTMGGLKVDGNAEIEHNVLVKGVATINELIVTENTTVSDITITGNIYAQDFTLTGTTAFPNIFATGTITGHDLVIPGDAMVGTLDVLNDASMTTLYVSDNAQIAELTIIGNASVNTLTAVEVDAGIINATFDVNAPVLNISEIATITYVDASNVGVSGMTETLDLSSNRMATLHDMSSDGYAVFNRMYALDASINKLQVEADASLNQLRVYNDTWMKNTYVSDLTKGNQLIMVGDTSLNTLTVSNDTNLNNMYGNNISNVNTTTSGNTISTHIIATVDTSSSSLFVSNGSVLNTLNVVGLSTMSNTNTTGLLAVAGNVSVSDTTQLNKLNVSGQTNLTDVSANNAKVYGNVEVDVLATLGNLNVPGQTNLHTTYVEGYLYGNDISNTNLIYTKDLTSTSIAQMKSMVVSSDASMNYMFTPLGEATQFYVNDLAGIEQLSVYDTANIQTLNVDANTFLHNTFISENLTVSKNTKTNSLNVDVSAAMPLLTVDTLATMKDTNITGTETVENLVGNTVLIQTGTVIDASASKMFIVDACMNNLTVNRDALVRGNISVANNVATRTLNVSETSTLNTLNATITDLSSVRVSGNAVFDSSVNALGVITNKVVSGDVSTNTITALNAYPTTLAVGQHATVSGNLTAGNLIALSAVYAPRLEVANIDASNISVSGKATINNMDASNIIVNELTASTSLYGVSLSSNRFTTATATATGDTSLNQLFVKGKSEFYGTTALIGKTSITDGSANAFWANTATVQKLIASNSITTDASVNNVLTAGNLTVSGNATIYNMIHLAKLTLNDMSANGLASFKSLTVLNDVSLNGSTYISNPTLETATVSGQLNTKDYVATGNTQTANLIATNGNITTLNATNATATTLNATAANITTGNFTSASASGNMYASYLGTGGDASSNRVLTNHVVSYNGMTVSGNATFNGNVDVKGTFTYTSIVSSQATVQGNTDVSNISVIGNSILNNLSATGNVDFSKMAVSGFATVLGDLSLNGRLIANNNAIFNNPSFFVGDASFGGNTFKWGTSHMYGPARIYNDASVNGVLYANTVAAVGAQPFIRFASDASFGNTIISNNLISNSTAIMRDISLNGNIVVNGLSTHNGKTNLVGDTSTNKLFVGEVAQFAQRVITFADASMNANANVGGNANIQQKLNVVGDTSVNVLYVANRAFLNSALTVAGDASFTTINTTQPARLNTIEIAKDASFNGNMKTIDGAYIGQNYYQFKNTTQTFTMPAYNMSSFQQDSYITITYWVQLTNNLTGNNNPIITLNGSNFIETREEGVWVVSSKQATFNATPNGFNIFHLHTLIIPVSATSYTTSNYLIYINDNTTTTASFTNNVSVLRNMPNTFSFGPMTAANLNSDMRIRDFRIYNRALTVAEIGGIYNGTFLDTTNLAVRDTTLPFNNLKTYAYSNFYVSSDGYVNKNLFVLGDTSLNGNLATGNTVSNAMTVLNDTSLNSALRVGGKTNMLNSLAVWSDVSATSLFVRTDVVANGNTQIGGNTVVMGDMSMNNNVKVGGNGVVGGKWFVVGDTSLNSLWVNGTARFQNITMLNSTLGDASMNGNVYVSGNHRVVGNSVVGGDTSLNTLSAFGNTRLLGNLIVGNDASMNANLVVAGNATIGRTLNTLGDISANGNLRLGGTISTNAAVSFGGDVSLNSQLVVGGNVVLKQPIRAWENVVMERGAVIGDNNTYYRFNDGASKITGSSLDYTGKLRNSYITVSMWVYISSNWNPSDANNATLLQISSTPIVKWANNQWVFGSLPSGFTIPRNQFVLITFLLPFSNYRVVIVPTFSGADVPTIVYVNLNATYSAVLNTIYMYNMIAPLAIGTFGTQANANNIFIRDFRIYGRALSEADIYNIYNRTFTSTTDLLQQYLLTNPTSATSYTNSVANSGAATITNCNTGTYVYSTTTEMVSDAVVRGNTAVSGNTTISGNLIVSGTASSMNTLNLSGGLSAVSDVSFNGNMVLGRDSTIRGNLAVGGDASMNGTLFLYPANATKPAIRALGDVSLNGLFTVVGNTRKLGGMYIMGDLSGDGSWNVSGNMYVRRNIASIGDASLNGALLLGGNAFLSRNMNVLGDVSMNQNLLVLGNTSVRGRHDVSGNMATDGSMNVGGNLFIGRNTVGISDASFGGNLFISQNSVLNGSQLINGDASMNGNVFMNRAVRVLGNTNVAGDVSFNRSLGVFGGSYFKNRVVMDGDLSLNGVLLLAGTVSYDAINIKSDLSMNRYLAVGSTTTLKEKLNVWSDVSGGGDLYLVGNASVEKLLSRSDVSLNGNVYANKNVVVANRLTSYGDVSFNATSFFGDRVWIDRDMYIKGLPKVEGNIDISGNCNVVKDMKAAGNITAKTNITAENSLTVSNDITVGGKLISTWLDLSLNLRASDSSVVKLTGDQTIAGNKTFSNDASFNGNVRTNRIISSWLDMSLNLRAFDASAVHLRGDETIAGNKTFTNDTYFNGNVRLLDNGRIMSSWLDASLNIRAFDASAVKLTDDQTIAGNKTFSNDTSFNGTVTVNNDLVCRSINSRGYACNLGKLIVNGEQWRVISSFNNSNGDSRIVFHDEGPGSAFGYPTINGPSGSGLLINSVSMRIRSYGGSTYINGRDGVYIGTSDDISPIYIDSNGLRTNNVRTNTADIYGSLTFNTDFATRDFATLIKTKPPFGIWGAESWDATAKIMREMTGKTGMNVESSGEITYNASVSGNGSNVGIPSISGEKSSWLRWPVGSIPNNFTVCSITRYTTTTGNDRILTSGKSVNWLHGHYQNKRGFAFYEGLKTPETTRGTITDWLVMCGKNGTSTTPYNILADGVGIGTATGGTGGERLYINHDDRNSWASTSNWALSYVLIWDQNLTDAEMMTVNNALRRHLDTGILLSYMMNKTDIYGVPVFNNHAVMQGSIGFGTTTIDTSGGVYLPTAHSNRKIVLLRETANEFQNYSIGTQANTMQFMVNGTDSAKNYQFSGASSTTAKTDFVKISSVGLEVQTGNLTIPNTGNIVIGSTNLFARDNTWSGNNTITGNIQANISGTIKTITPTQLSYLSEFTSSIKTEIDGKANDTAVVKLTGEQEVGGNKTFTGTTRFNGSLSANGTAVTTTQLGYLSEFGGSIKSLIDAKANDNEVVKLALAQTITGDKTFSGTTSITGNITANLKTITPTQLGYLSDFTQTQSIKQYIDTNSSSNSLSGNATSELSLSPYTATPTSTPMVVNDMAVSNVINGNQLFVYGAQDGLYFARSVAGVMDKSPTKMTTVTTISAVYACAMSRDATKLVIVIGNGTNNTLSWGNVSTLLTAPSTSITFTQFDSVNRVYRNIAISGDGTRVVASDITGLYYTTYSGSSFSALSFVIGMMGIPCKGVALTYDGNTLAYVSNQVAYWAVWNTSTNNFSAGTQIYGQLNIGSTSASVSQTITSDQLVDFNATVFTGNALMTDNTTTVTNATTSTPINYRNGTYTSSASSAYSISNDYSWGSYKTYRAFDGTKNDSGWHTNTDGSTSKYNSSAVGVASYISNASTTVVNSPALLGEWLQVELPYKIVVKCIIIYPRPNSSSTGVIQTPYKFALLGTNSSTNDSWSLITSVDSAVGYTVSRDKYFYFTPTNLTPYRKLRLSVQQVSNNGSGHLAIPELNFIGDIYVSTTTTLPTDLTGELGFVGTTNTLIHAPSDGRIQFTDLSQNQYNQWSSTVVRNSPAFVTNAYAINEANLFKSGLLVLSNQTDKYRNGTYIVSTSSDYLESANYFSGWSAFNRISSQTSSYGWHGYIRLDTVNVFTTNIKSAQSIKGEWIQIQFPFKLLLKSVEFFARRDNVSRLPVSFVIVGSNDGYEWNILYSQDTRTFTYSGTSINTIPIPGVNTAYCYLRLIVRKLDGAEVYVNLQQLNYIGDIYENVPTNILSSTNQLQTSSISNTIAAMSNGLICYYPFDVDTFDYSNGVRANDLIVNGTDTKIVSISNSSNYPETKLSIGSLYFNGTSSSYCQLPNIQFGSGGITVAFWVNCSSKTSGARFFDFGVSSANFFGVGLNDTNNIALYYYSGGTTNSNTTTSGTDSTWKHICLTVASNGSCAIYINASSTSALTNATTITSLTGVFTCYINRNYITASGNFTGYMNQFVVFNRVLSTTEISVLYNTIGSFVNPLPYSPTIRAITTDGSNNVYASMYGKPTLLQSTVSTVGSNTFAITQNKITAKPIQLLPGIMNSYANVYANIKDINGNDLCYLQNRQVGNANQLVWNFNNMNAGCNMVWNTLMPIFNKVSDTYSAISNNNFTVLPTNTDVNSSTSIISLAMSDTQQSSALAIVGRSVSDKSNGLYGCTITNGVWGSFYALTPTFSPSTALPNAIDTISTTTNYKMYFSFDQNTVSGTSVTGISSSSNITATLSSSTNVVVSTTDKVMGTSCISMTGGGYVTLPSYQPDTNGITIACWFKFGNVYNGAERIFDIGNGQTDNLIAKANGDFFVLRGNAAGTSGLVTLSENYIVNDTKWHHLAWTLTYDNTETNSTWKIYTDGNLRNSSTGKYYPKTSVNRTTSCYLAKSNWGEATPDLKVDDFRIYNKVLTADEVKTLYKAGTLSFSACSLSRDKTKFIVSVGNPIYAVETSNVNWNSYIYWGNASSVSSSSTAITLTQISETTARNYIHSSMTPDGNRIVVTSTNGIYYSDWNGNNYNTLTLINIPELTAISTIYYNNACISSDGMRIAFTVSVASADIRAYYCVWNGSNYGNMVLIGNVNNNNSQTLSSRNLQFLDNAANIIVYVANNQPGQYSVWDGNTYSSFVNINTQIWTSYFDYQAVHADKAGNIFIIPYNQPLFLIKINYSLQDTNVLYVSGSGITASGRINVVSVSQNSDARLKHDVKSIGSQLETIKKLAAHQFKWNKDEREDIGFIAQEVMEYYPSIVCQNVVNNEMIYSLDYSKFAVLLWKGLQETVEIIETQKEEINELKQTVQTQKEELVELETLKTTVETQQKELETLKQQMNAILAKLG